MNWKKKFKNKAFCITLATTLVAFIYQFLGICGIVPKVSEGNVMQVVGMAINLLAVLGIIVNPNTPGITDTEGE